MSLRNDLAYTRQCRTIASYDPPGEPPEDPEPDLSNPHEAEAVAAEILTSLIEDGDAELPWGESLTTETLADASNLDTSDLWIALSLLLDPSPENQVKALNYAESYRHNAEAYLTGLITRHYSR